MKKSVSIIFLPDRTSTLRVETNDIMFCEGDNNYTRFHFHCGGSRFVCRTLKQTEKELPAENFCRVHKKYILNMNYVLEYENFKSGKAILKNGICIPVSLRRKKIFAEKLRQSLAFPK